MARRLRFAPTSPKSSRVSGRARAHNVSSLAAYLDHRDLAEPESRTEHLFITSCCRMRYARALASAPRLALGWLAPLAPALGDPRVRSTATPQPRRSRRATRRHRPQRQNN
jgi:hypothetical protein